MKLRNLAFALALAVQVVGAQDAKKTTDQKQEQAADPVCGMTVDTATSPKSEFKGKTYYFCSIDDKKEFDRSPASYIKIDKKDTTKK